MAVRVSLGDLLLGQLPNLWPHNSIELLQLSLGWNQYKVGGGLY